jgi:4a-hydroxytetrahydrobiopterin dehydratase
MSDLAKKRCVPCEEGGEALFCEKAEELQAQLNPEWMLIDQCRMLARTFNLPDFKSALELANKIGALAEEEGHHPDLTLGYGNLGVELTTHAVGGLSENDFILAAKIDEIAN